MFRGGFFARSANKNKMARQFKGVFRDGFFARHTDEWKVIRQFKDVFREPQSLQDQTRHLPEGQSLENFGFIIPRQRRLGPNVSKKRA